MADVTSQGPRCTTVRRRRNTEFWVYFTLIFLTALPFATIGWIRDVVRQRTLNLHGPLARAWREADQIAPLIFSA